jgi:hypothetical protein
MLRTNPMAGGPAYIIALRNALESASRPGQYNQPPKQRGGPQLSVRFDDFQFNHIDAIAEKTGWNRSEVINALLHRGLFDLYEYSDPSTVEAVVHRVVEKLLPSQPPAILEPHEIEYCRSNGELLDNERYPYPIGHETSPAACLALAQHLLNSWWRVANGKLEPMSKSRSLPELVRITNIRGEEICRWSIDDLKAS